MDTVMPPTPDEELSGLWRFDGQHERVDDRLAKTKMGSDDKEQPPLHGTYTKFCYHRVFTRSAPMPDDPKGTRIPNFVLEIFDEEGNFGHFVWNSTLKWGEGSDEVGAWEFRNEPVVVKVDPDKRHLPKGDTLTLRPDLTLTPFNKQDPRFPRNGANEDVPCPLPFIPP
jgi:hypothetical protein